MEVKHACKRVSQLKRKYSMKKRQLRKLNDACACGYLILTFDLSSVPKTKTRQNKYPRIKLEHFYILKSLSIHNLFSNFHFICFCGLIFILLIIIQDIFDTDNVIVNIGEIEIVRLCPRHRFSFLFLFFNFIKRNLMFFCTTGCR